MNDSQGIEDMIDALARNARRASFETMEADFAVLETHFPLMANMDREALIRIRTKAEHFAACLTAAARGIRSGHRRLAEIAAASRTDTYDRSGARRALTQGEPGRRL